MLGVGGLLRVANATGGDNYYGFWGFRSAKTANKFDDIPGDTITARRANASTSASLTAVTINDVNTNTATAQIGFNQRHQITGQSAIWAVQ